MLRDAADVSRGAERRTDVLVIGGGAAGITVARALAGGPLHVTLLEIGESSIDNRFRSSERWSRATRSTRLTWPTSGIWAVPPITGAAGAGPLVPGRLPSGLGWLRSLACRARRAGPLLQARRGGGPASRGPGRVVVGLGLLEVRAPRAWLRARPRHRARDRRDVAAQPPDALRWGVSPGARPVGERRRPALSVPQVYLGGVLQNLRALWTLTPQAMVSESPNARDVGALHAGMRPQASWTRISRCSARPTSTSRRRRCSRRPASPTRR